MVQPASPSTPHADPLLAGLHNLDALGRDVSRRVLRESGEVWAEIWEEVIRIQDANPDVRRIAEGMTDDPKQAIVDIIPRLAFLNPLVVRGVVAFCWGVVDELGYGGEAVSPRRDAPQEGASDGDGETDVGRESVGGDQLHDRVARVEAKQMVIDDLVDEVQELLAQLGDRLGSREAQSLGDPDGLRSWRAAR